MTKKTFDLEFKGYWRERDGRGLPAYSGVFVVQSYYHDHTRGTVTMKALIYVGKADNIHERVKSHEKRSLWKRKLKPGEGICYSCTPVKKEDQERVTAALIYAHQPLANRVYKDAFPFDTTRVNLRGDYFPLEEKVVVEKN
ncbi:hypothetical protein LS482_05610 [Sinomicrobium kalidii]|uniref:GIY-YIG nuclease family protein n=1 Tax=Sinomicrobium kalidii TaxID=2900738 RepID=UPI001E2FF2E9|nr:GIY-YIG nuclease family protein [Sinomicrobium kalidii]UGU17347.1 hypothetical protein LS482_05610 [Sinomicrobium kalidii]